MLHSDRYTKLIDPQNAALKTLLVEVLEPQSPTISKRRYLDHYLLLLRDFKYFNVSGLTSLDQVIASRSGNCLSLVCVLCSLLRASNFSDSEVFAAIGCVKGFHLTTMHAYAIIKGLEPEDLVLVDPEVMNVKSVDYELLSANYSLFVLFNDRRQAAQKQEIAELLTVESRLLAEARASS